VCLYDIFDLVGICFISVRWFCNVMIGCRLKLVGVSRLGIGESLYIVRFGCIRL